MATPTSTQFAVAAHVLTYLTAVQRSGDDRAVSSDELSASTNVSPVHIRKVLGPLREAGLVRSRSGQQGGWVLGASPEDIALVQVYDVLLGDRPVVGIHLPSPQCPVGRGIRRSLEDLDRELLEGVRGRLAGISVADLLDRSDITVG